MATVQFEKIVKHYPGNAEPTVRPLDLSIADGEFIVLVGPSGCGKSTLLRMIAGLTDASDGRMRIDDTDITRLPPKDRDIAMVFQNYALFPHMNVHENISFGLRIRKMDKAEIARRVDTAVEILGLEKFLDQKPGQLSGGQRQRVAVGRAIVRRPKVFLFDEPLSNLDAKLRTQMRAEISRLHRKLKVTTIYVTHDQAEAMTMADRIVVLHNGIVQQCGRPLEVYAKPANTFVAGFIGSPAMNLFDARLEDGKLKAGELSIPAPKGTAGKLGIRPEDICLAERKEDGVRYSAAFDCEVELAESLGNEICLHCRGAGLSFQSTQKINFEIRTGETIRMVFALDKFHAFDADGRAIR
ncbi:MAG: sn-glycerol-3-phosphate ABC transporter ATP-binding protein UgpC [Elusimicrobiota bacterium]